MCHAFKSCQIAVADVPFPANPTFAAVTGYVPYVEVWTNSSGAPRYSSKVPCRNSATKSSGAAVATAATDTLLVLRDGDGDVELGAIPVTVAGKHVFALGPQLNLVVTSRSVNAAVVPALQESPPSPRMLLLLLLLLLGTAMSTTRVARVWSESGLMSSSINVLVPPPALALCFRSQSAERCGSPVVASRLPTIEAGTGAFSVQYGTVSSLPWEHGSLDGFQLLSLLTNVHAKHWVLASHAVAQSCAVMSAGCRRLSLLLLLLLLLLSALLGASL